MRKEFLLTGAGLALIGGLAGCGGNALGGAPAEAAVVPASTPAAPADPDAPKYVPYHDYRDAALQMSIRPDLLVPATTFRQSLATLCHTAPQGFTDLRRHQRLSARSDSDPGSALAYRADEISLRIDMACPQRMGDWITARDLDDQSHDDSATDGPSPTPSPGPTTTSDTTSATDSATASNGADAAALAANRR